MRKATIMDNVQTHISNQSFFNNGELLLKSISIKPEIKLQEAIQKTTFFTKKKTGKQRLKYSM